MKWMVICLFLSQCGEPQAETTEVYLTKAECEARADKESVELDADHKSHWRPRTLNYRCIEVRP